MYETWSVNYSLMSWLLCAKLWEKPGVQFLSRQHYSWWRLLFNFSSLCEQYLVWYMNVFWFQHDMAFFFFYYFSKTGHIWKIQQCGVLQRGIHTSHLPWQVRSVKWSHTLKWWENGEWWTSCTSVLAPSPPGLLNSMRSGRWKFLLTSRTTTTCCSPSTTSAVNPSRTHHSRRLWATP